MTSTAVDTDLTYRFGEWCVAQGWTVFLLATDGEGGKFPTGNCAECPSHGELDPRTGQRHDAEVCEHLLCHGFYAATRDLERLRAMLQVLPNGYLAVRTGRSSRLVVIDAEADLHPKIGKTGVEVLEEWDQWTGFELPSTLTAKTVRGGFHLFYRLDEGEHVRTQPGKLPKIDVKAEGGYVAVPCGRNVRAWFGSITAPSSPSTVLRTWLGTSANGKASGEGAFSRIDTLLTGPMTELRDETAKSLAASMRRMGLTERQAADLMTMWWQTLPQPTGKAPFPLVEALKKLTSAWHKFDPLLGNEIETIDADDTNPLGFRTLVDIRGGRKAPVWLVREALLADGFGVIGGAEKTLKSMILTLFTIAVASGRALFCDDRFVVKERGKVLVLTGEGSVDLFLDRLEHLCKLCGIDPADLDEWVEVTDKIQPTTSETFREGIRRAIDRFKPALVILDPAYVYVAADDQAGNVFKMGKLLADLRDLCKGRAVLVGHHFTKIGKDDLSLSSLTQAGFREVFDHWLLVAHAQDPDLDQQYFKLHARLGARRGFAWDATFEVTLGKFNLDELKHEGTPGWKVLAPETRGQQKDGADWRRLVYEHIGAEPERFTKSELVGSGEGCNARAKAFAWLEANHLIVQVPTTRPRQHGRPVPVKVWKQTVPGVFDDALARLQEAST